MPIPTVSVKGQPQESRSVIPQNGQASPSHSVRTAPAPDSRPDDCSTFPDLCFKKTTSALPDGQLAEQEPASQPQGSNTQAGNKLTFADFEAAKQQGNYGVAFDIAKKLDAAGDPAGAYGQGDFYVHGYGRVPKDPAAARALFARAAEMGFPEAMVKLGLMYHDGIGGDKDKQAARTWFEKTAASDDTEARGQAMWALGTMCKRHEAGMYPCDADDFYAKAKAAGYTADK